MASWRRSAAYRIALVYSGAFALGVALLGVVVFWAMHVAFTRQLDAIIADEAASLVAEARSDGTGELADTIAQREAGASRTRLLYAVFDREGRRIQGHLQTPAPAPGVHDIRLIDARGEPASARGLAIDLGGGNRLLVAADGERIKQIDRTIISVFAAGFATIVLLGLAGALVLGSYLRRRLSAIGDGAEAIIGGDISRRMPVSMRDDEFDRLARSLNAMLERIGGLIENVRQVSSDVAHDLRTPLTRLRNQLEKGVSASAAGPVAQDKVIEEAIRRVDEVLALFSAIMRIAEVESGQIRRNFEPVDLSALAVELAESYAPALADGGRSLTWTIAPGLRVDGDRELIAQAVVNLLENGQRHTPKGTAISMALTAAGDTIHLSVADSGPGVAEEDRNRIVQRFTRLDSSRTTAGHGLGLNLVAAIVRLHNARLVFADNRPGLVVTIEFPGGTARGSRDELSG
jgi:signal transduction histidine kinase